MNAEDTVRELRNVQQKHKNDHVFTGGIRISDMARDCADMIESLQAQLSESQRRERAAIEDIYKIKSCSVCKYRNECDPDYDIDTNEFMRWRDCTSKGDKSGFEWRGDVADEGEGK